MPFCECTRCRRLHHVLVSNDLEPTAEAALQSRRCEQYCNDCWQAMSEDERSELTANERMLKTP
jgi:hypothetical protein